MKQTQCQRLLAYLRSGMKITSLGAWQALGIARLASRINDLVKQGVGIKREWLEVTNRFGEKCKVKQYWLEEEGRLF